MTWKVIGFSVRVLTVARLVPILVALIGSGLTCLERLVAAWFGPKGFASVIYGLMLLRSDIPNAERLYVLVAVTIVMSICSTRRATCRSSTHSGAGHRERQVPASAP